MKRGFQTSEGKLAIATIIGQLIAALFGQLPPEYAGVGATLVAIGYAFSRGFTKAGGAEAIDALVTTEPQHPHP
jgi:hypothetical protein